ncbi:hypothetical protein [Marinobacter santoriniensis]|uniref:hypothetical protein n=1 Tax=Marinobacter santoriniensis TaxID=523742 RepID=UPI00059472D4|nr:hypothetical protein [Marinobacter santoriniensis]
MTKNRHECLSLEAYRRRKKLLEIAGHWRENLPEPSKTYPHLIFLYPEELATRQRELLFKRLEVAASKNGQILVISDCHYSRAGFYVVYEEIGEAGSNLIDIDRIVDDWSDRDG